MPASVGLPKQVGASGWVSEPITSKRSRRATATRGAFAACTAGWARPLRSYGIKASENVTGLALTQSRSAEAPSKNSPLTDIIVPTGTDTFGTPTASHRSIRTVYAASSTARHATALSLSWPSRPQVHRAAAVVAITVLLCARRQLDVLVLAHRQASSRNSQNSLTSKGTSPASTPATGVSGTLLSSISAAVGLSPRS